MHQPALLERAARVLHRAGGRRSHPRLYKRNYIEGLFLSSGIIGSSEYTMERLLRVARMLREAHGFKGYIHLKTIPEVSAELIEQAARP